MASHPQGQPSAPAYPGYPGYPDPFLAQGYPAGGGAPPPAGFTQPPPYPGPAAPYPAPGGYPPSGGAYPGNTSYPSGPYPPTDFSAARVIGGPDPQAMYGSAYGDEPLTGEAATNFADFNEKSIRMGFIRKVYSILSVQLLITFGFIMLFTFVEPVRRFSYQNPAVFYVAIALTFVCIITLACCPNVRRKTPTNFIVLFIFTLAESFLLGVTASRYGSDVVMMAVGATVAVCLALTLFAMQTKWDFTMMGGALLVCLVVFVIFGIVAAFFPGKTLRLVYASLGAILFSLYLIYDTQLMMGGKHKYSISPEEYIFAALNLYLDIVNIFIYLLTIIGSSRD